MGFGKKAAQVPQTAAHKRDNHKQHGSEWDRVCHEETPCLPPRFFIHGSPPTYSAALHTWTKRKTVCSRRDMLPRQPSPGGSLCQSQLDGVRSSRCSAAQRRGRL